MVCLRCVFGKCCKPQMSLLTVKDVHIDGHMESSDQPSGLVRCACNDAMAGYKNSADR